jgi:cytochrome b involved in lipid metabolism
MEKVPLGRITTPFTPETNHLLTVYDVSEYLDDHPGGKDVLLEMAGSDATAEFDFVGHSIDAKKTLESFEVGLLAGYVGLLGY